MHRGGPTGRILFQGTIDKGANVPFNGKSFWVSVSSPENLTIMRRRDDRVRSTGLQAPKALTVTATRGGRLD